MRVRDARCWIASALLALSSSALADVSAPEPRSPAADVAASDSALRVDTAMAFGSIRLPIRLPVPASKTGAFDALVISYDEGAPPWSSVGALWRLDVPSIARVNDSAGPGLVLRRGSASTRLVQDEQGALVEQIGNGDVRYRQLVDGAGIAYFERVDADGIRYVFGPSDASRDTASGVVHQWWLSSLQDPSGNRISFRYGSQVSPEVKQLASIEYDQHDAIGGGPLQISLAYAPRVSVGSSYDQGVEWRGSTRLSEITIASRPTPFAAWRTESRYRLHYSAPVAGGTGASPFTTDGLLQRVEQIAGTSNRTLYALEYQGAGWGAAPDRFELPVATTRKEGHLVFSDVLSAGWRSLVELDGATLRGGNTEVELLPSGHAANLDSRRLTTWTVVGRTVLCALGNDALYCAQADGVGHLPDPKDMRITPGWSAADYASETFRDGLRLGDVNGDGRVDACARHGETLQCVQDLLGSVPPALWSSLSLGNDALSWKSMSLIDVNADRRDDVCWLTATTLECALTSNTLGGAGRITLPFAMDRAGQLATFSFVSLNRDPYPDVCGRINSSLQCRLGTGSGFVDAGWSLDLAGRPLGDERFPHSFVYLHLNLDGLTDLCLLATPNGFSCHVSLDRGFSASIGGPLWTGVLPGGAGNREALYFKNAPEKTIAVGNGHQINPKFVEWAELVTSPTSADHNGDGAQELCVRANLAVFDCWDAKAARRLHVSRLTLEEGARESFAWELNRGGNHLRLHRDVMVLRTLENPDFSTRSRTAYAYESGYFSVATGEFRGYRRVGETRLAGTSTPVHSAYEFHQGDEVSADAAIASLAGALRLVQTNEGGFRALSLYYSDSTNAASPYRRPRLRKVLRQWCDGGGCNPVIAVKPNRPWLDRERPDLLAPPWPVDPPRAGGDFTHGPLTTPWTNFERAVPSINGEVLALQKRSASLIATTNSLTGAGWTVPRIPAAIVPAWVEPTSLWPLSVCRPGPGATQCGFDTQVFKAENDVIFDIQGVANAPGHWHALFRASYTELDYDAVGNVLEERHGWYAPTGVAKRRVRREYAAAGANTPINRLTRERVYLDDALTEHSEFHVRYDEHATVDDPSDCGDVTANPGPISRGLPTQIQRWEDGPAQARVRSTERFAYDARGNVSCVWNRAGGLTRYGYSQFRWLAEREENALGHVSTRAFHGLGSTPGPRRFALPYWTRSPLGNTVRFDYDDAGQLARTAHLDAQGAEKAWETVTHTHRTAAAGPTTTYATSDGTSVRVTLSAFAEPQSLAWQGVDGAWRDVLRRHDVAGRLVGESQAAPVSTPADKRRWATVEYDNAGRPLRLQPLTAGATTICRWQHTVAVTRPGGRITVVEYSPFETPAATHRVSKVQPPPPITIGDLLLPAMDAVEDDPLIALLAAGDLPIPCRGGHAEAEDVITHRFARDALGRVVSVERPGTAGPVQVEYAPNAQLRQVRDPEIGDSLWKWGSDGQLQTSTGPDGVSRRYARDLLARVTRSEVVGQEATQWRSFSYDAGCTGCVGQLTEFATPEVTVTRRYDGFGHLASESSAFEGATRKSELSYSVLGQLREFTYPDGSRARYGYRHGGKATLDYNDHSIVGAPTLDAHGRVIRLPLGDRLKLRYAFHRTDSGCNGTTSRLCRMEAAIDLGGGLPEQIAMQLRWTYDAADQIQSVADLHAGGVSFEYDGFNRLLRENHLDGAKVFAYAPHGGLASQSAEGTYRYDTVKRTQLLSTDQQQLTYGAGGRVASIDGIGASQQEFEYSGFGVPRSIEEVDLAGASVLTTLITDALGEVRGFKRDGTLTRLDLGQRCVNNDCRNQIVVDGRPIATAVAGDTKAGVAHWLISEPNGTVRLVLDAALQPVARPRFAGFGRGLSDATHDSTLSPWMDHLSVTADLKLIGARLYSTSLGQFLQPDQAWFDPLSPTPTQRFAYAAQNPIGFTDVGGFRTASAGSTSPKSLLDRAESVGRIYGGITTIGGGIAVGLAVAGSVTVAAAAGGVLAAGLVVGGVLAVVVGSFGLITGDSLGDLETIADYATLISISSAGKIAVIPTLVGIGEAIIGESDSVDEKTKQGISVVSSRYSLHEAISDYAASPTRANAIGAAVAMVDHATSVADALTDSVQREMRESQRDGFSGRGSSDFRFDLRSINDGNVKESQGPLLDGGIDPPETHIHDPPEVDTDTGNDNDNHSDPDPGPVQLGRKP